MKVGVTGTRYGMSPDQKRIFAALIHKAEFNDDDPLTELHYGDCFGTDAEIAEEVINRDLGHILHCHPATNGDEWDEKWCARTYLTHAGEGIVVYAAKPPLERNIDIVEAVDVLWAFPQNASGKGGTWYTINQAFDRDVPVRIVTEIVSRLHRGK